MPDEGRRWHSTHYCHNKFLILRYISKVRKKPNNYILFFNFSFVKLGISNVHAMPRTRTASSWPGARETIQFPASTARRTWRWLCGAARASSSGAAAAPTFDQSRQGRRQYGTTWSSDNHQLVYIDGQVLPSFSKTFQPLPGDFADLCLQETTSFINSTSQKKAAFSAIKPETTYIAIQYLICNRRLIVDVE